MLLWKRPSITSSCSWMFGSQLFTSCVKCEKARRFRQRRVFMRLPSLLVMISAITCSSPVLSGAGWRMTRAEYCWPSCCQLMVAVRRVGVEQLLARPAACCLREHDLLGLRHDSARPSGSGSVDDAEPASAIPPWWSATGPGRGRGLRRMPPMRLELRDVGNLLPACGVASASIGASMVCSPVPGSSSTSSTGSGAGCGSAASVNSSLFGPSRVSSCTDSSGTSVVVVAGDVQRRCRRRAA